MPQRFRLTFVNINGNIVLYSENTDPIVFALLPSIFRKKRVTKRDAKGKVIEVACTQEMCEDFILRVEVKI